MVLHYIFQHEHGKIWNIAIEFRNKSWYHNDTYDLLNYYKTAMVLQDKSGATAPLEELDAPYIYVRFHGPTGNYRGSYDEIFLNEYAGYINGWLENFCFEVGNFYPFQPSY